LADRAAFPYLLQEWCGKTVPLITALLWSENGAIVSPEPWPVAYGNGAHLIRASLGGEEGALVAAAADCDLSADQVALARTLLGRKLASESAPIVLSTRESDVAFGSQPRAPEEARKALADLGIEVR
jgi:hypothetical protein